jgi:hypothetical protein
MTPRETHLAWREETALIERYNLLLNRMNAYSTKTPLRYKVRTQEEMASIRHSLRCRGLYYAGNGRFCSVPED